MSTQDETPTIGLPQLAACLVIGFFVYRYFSSSTRPTTAATTSTPSNSGRPSAQQLRRLQDQAQLVQAILPHLSTNAIIWELQKNGGSVQDTVEKALAADGRLPEPPTPIVPVPTPAANSSTSTATNRRPAASTTATGATASGSSTGKNSQQYPDLITRYNLADRLHEDPSESSEASGAEGGAGTPGGKGKQAAWSQNKAERAANLQRRRDEMILQARRKLEEEERRKGKGKEKEVEGN